MAGDNPIITFIGLLIIGAVFISVSSRSDPSIAPALLVGGVISFVAAVAIIFALIRH